MDEPSNFMEYTSVEVVSRESVKQLSTTLLNSIIQAKQNMSTHMHQVKACTKVVNGNGENTVVTYCNFSVKYIWKC